MKLHFLHIQAFGPFANKEVVDFSKLGENPLFLIDGPTGAGKSSILHAIVTPFMVKQRTQTAKAWDYGVTTQMIMS